MTPDQLRGTRDSYAIVLRGLIRDIEKDSNSAFFLMEGKDGDYYRPRIGALMAGSDFSLNYRNCRGKRNMIPLLHAIESNSTISDKKIVFFFDRDYENDISEISRDRCYLTDGYSIENYYTSVKSFLDICAFSIFVDLTSSDDEQDEMTALEDAYKVLQCQFHSQISLFNSWAWCQRHYPSSGTINLDDFSVVDKFTIDVAHGNVSSNYSLNDLNALAPERVPVAQDSINEANEWFTNRNVQLSFRGKQERDFLFLVLSALIDLSAAGQHPFQRKRKCKKRISRNELIGDLSSAAATPISLTNFVSVHRAIWEAASARQL